jgi:hypothetical protein
MEGAITIMAEGTTAPVTEATVDTMAEATAAGVTAGAMAPIPGDDNCAST